MAEFGLERLLERIAFDDDKEAFSILFKMYHARLVRFALFYVNSYNDAEDVVSEVMIKLLRRRKELVQIRNFSSYLFTAVKNQALNHRKRYESRVTVSITDIPQDSFTDGYEEPMERVLANELRAMIISTVEKLPSKRRMVYLMVKDEGLSIREVSELLEIAEKTVKKHLELALKDLRKAIEAFYAEKKSIGCPIKLPLDLSSSFLTWQN
jgi:RNA polymerase sigma-70 factor (ECF subfamily)